MVCHLNEQISEIVALKPSYILCYWNHVQLHLIDVPVLNELSWALIIVPTPVLVHIITTNYLLFSPHTEPDVIRNLTVSEITTSFAFLTWHEPVGNKSFFKIQWTNDKTSGNCTETSDTFHNITGLTAGVNYTFCITAVAADQSTEGETVCISQFTSM